MTQAAYRIIQTRIGFKVEIDRPGEIIQFADCFSSEADASAWITEERRLAGLDDIQVPPAPPHVREV